MDLSKQVWEFPSTPRCHSNLPTLTPPPTRASGESWSHLTHSPTAQSSPQHRPRLAGNVTESSNVAKLPHCNGLPTTPQWPFAIVAPRRTVASSRLTPRRQRLFTNWLVRGIWLLTGCACCVAKVFRPRCGSRQRFWPSPNRLGRPSKNLPGQ